jgi:hypothetical protein
LLCIQLILQLSVLFAEDLVLGVVQLLLMLCDLGLDVVNLLLLRVEASRHALLGHCDLNQQTGGIVVLGMRLEVRNAV